MNKKFNNLTFGFNPPNSISHIQANEVQQFQQSLEIINTYLPQLSQKEILIAVNTYGHSNVYLHATRYGRLPF